jgi:hypothetical protein
MVDYVGLFSYPQVHMAFQGHCTEYLSVNFTCRYSFMSFVFYRYTAREGNNGKFQTIMSQERKENRFWVNAMNVEDVPFGSQVRLAACLCMVCLLLARQHNQVTGATIRGECMQCDVMCVIRSCEHWATMQLP